MKISKTTAVDLLKALNFKTAANWDATKLADKLSKLGQLDDIENETLDDERLQKALKATLAAAAKEDEIVVTEPVEEAAEEEAPKKPAAKKPAAKAKAEEEGAEAEEESVPVHPKKPTAKQAAAAKEAAAKAKAAKAKAAKEAKEPHRTLHYLAGALLKEHGLDTDPAKLVKELNKLSGRSNDAESLFQIKKAVNAIKGYLGK